MNNNYFQFDQISKNDSYTFFASKLINHNTEKDIFPACPPPPSQQLEQS